MSLPDRYDEHLRIFTVALALSGGFAVGNYLVGDFKQHPLRDGALVGAFAYAAYRSIRMNNDIVNMTTNKVVYKQEPTPAQQIHYNGRLLEASACLPAALALQFASVSKPDAMTYTMAIVLGGLAVGTLIGSRKCHNYARTLDT